MSIGNTLFRTGLLGALAVATAVAGLPPDVLAHGKKKAAIRIAPLSKADHKRIRFGASAWLHKRDVQYLVINDDGGHIRAGGHFRRLRQIAPKGSWGCVPATFRDRKQGITVRTARHRGAWTLSVATRAGRTRMTGLKCGSGS
jgi:hypothetical protein